MKMQNNFRHITTGSTRMGMILMVDISGYTRFVQKTNGETGAAVIDQLISALVEADKLKLYISEIEGDAIFFYRYGMPPSAKTLQLQYERMLYAFREARNGLSAGVPEVASLSVKMVAHYGPLTEHSVLGFKKLYGQPVIEAHRLLKNQVNSDTYMLITEDLLAQHPKDHCQQDDVFEICEVYDFGRICYRYLSYAVREISPEVLVPRIPSGSTSAVLAGTGPASISISSKLSRLLLNDLPKLIQTAAIGLVFL